LNPDSLKIIKDCALELSLSQAKPGEKFQFARTGYFCADSKYPGVFNRIVPLKDSWSKKK
jgi:glutaminyl-tRNA synthetase